MKPKAIEFDAVFTASERSVLATAWEEDHPEGIFFKGRHGYTHYVLDSNEDDGEKSNKTKKTKGVVVLSHGIGTSSHMYKSMAQDLVRAGYTVVRYDFFGHGYSKYTGGTSSSSATTILWVPFTATMLVDQLEDLMEMVLRRKDGTEEEKENVVAFVGHSTGGLVGIHAAHRWAGGGGCSRSSSSSDADKELLLKQQQQQRSLPQNLILVSPALWAKKPFISRVVDKIPRFFAWVMSKLPFLNFLISDAYMGAGEIAWAIDPTTGEYIYPEEQKKSKEQHLRLFGGVKGVQKHPFLVPALNSINWGILKGDLYAGHRETMEKVLDYEEKTKRMKIFHLWGDLDATVPFATNYDIAKKWEKDQKYGSYHLEPLQRLGHEAIFENSTLIGKRIVSWLQDQ